MVWAVSRGAGRDSDFAVRLCYNALSQAVVGPDMSRLDLPDGVPPDNGTKTGFSAADAAGKSQDYSAPDMATPQFSQPQTTHSVIRQTTDSIVEDGGDHEGRATKLLPSPVNSIMMFTALAAVLALLGAIAIASNQKSVPNCASQPDWNQYNCQAH